MYKQILSVFLIFLIVGVSGCTINPEAQSTWGEKEPVNVDYLHIINSTGKYIEKNGTAYYYVSGYIGNKAEYDALNVEIQAKAYDKDGNLIGTNNNTYLKPKIIPTNGTSYFYTRFNDSEHKIFKYELKPVIKY